MPYFKMHNTINYLVFIALFCFTLIFSGCESNNMLKSQKKMEEDIQHTWELVSYSPGPPTEEWIFVDGTLLRNLLKPDGTIADSDTATYLIETKVSEALLIVSGFKRLSDKLNGTWSLIQLDEKILMMAVEHNNTGLIIKEFVVR
jgi:hypothetical protein